MRLRIAIDVLAAAFPFALLLAGVPQGPAQPSRPPVVVELFTSEGCSSCPPADDELRALEAGGAGGVAEVVAIGEHVDYWDRLGWRDPFSSPVFSARQSEYDATVFRSGEIYTPQLVVDGSAQAVGSDHEAIRRLIAAAARRPKALVRLSAERSSGSRVMARVRVELPPSLAPVGAADIMVAVTEGPLVSRVRRGENGGRTLTHSAVARLLIKAGVIAPTDRAGSADVDLDFAQDWNVNRLRVIAFVQERESRRIIGAGTTIPR